MINTTENLILIDNQITKTQIESCQYNSTQKKYDIIFQGNPKVSSYDAHRILWLKHPIKLDPRIYQVTHKGRKLSNIDSISVFSSQTHKYWHIRFSNGKEYNYNENNLQIIRSCLENKVSRNVFEYLKQVATVNAITADDGTKLLAKQYNNIDFIAKNMAIATYLNPQNFKPHCYSPKTLIFPFGCNASQQKAVQTAFENKISVIQGPPGTGKTQTILNIIANILEQGKTVQVVSNNNSAIINVLEKLSKYDIAFIVAPLGNSDNKKKFIKSQETEKQYPNHIISWHHPDLEKPDFFDNLSRQTEELSNIFSKQEQLATARQEIKSLEIEWTHYKQEFGFDSPTIKLRRFINSSQLIRLWHECQHLEEIRSSSRFKLIANLLKKLRWFIFRLKSRIICNISNKKIDSQDIANIISELQLLFYKTRHAELQSEIKNIEKYLSTKNSEELTKQICDISMQYLKNSLFHRYGSNRTKPIFTSDDLKNNWQKVQEEYPVVLSTTFSSLTSLHKDATYDYLIMDEASQISVETGALAISHAQNVIIVGDSMQLSNIVKKEDKYKLDAITQNFHIAEGYDCANNSFLQSICKVIPNIPQTLLREHYRCHPKIINFCNLKFYGGNLLIMTHDNGEEDVICAIKTTVGNHSRDHMNQREIDVIKEEVLPNLSYQDTEIGIIAPYNKQIEAIQYNLGNNIDIKTVHKFQGREKDAIIMTTVDDIITEFTDDPNLLNVAVSRAKQKFCLVVSGNKQPDNCNISDLIAYIEYNNCSITNSKIHSIFDYLYKPYSKICIDYLKKHPKISKYKSENLTYALITDILKNNINMKHLTVICHLPLRHLICDLSLLNEEERKFVKNINTHIDFFICNGVGKFPVLAIETDGYRYHKPGTTQAERDEMKNHILERYKIPLVRLSTTGSNERKIVEEKLMDILHLH